MILASSRSVKWTASIKRDALFVSSSLLPHMVAAVLESIALMMPRISAEAFCLLVWAGSMAEGLTAGYPYNSLVL